MSTKSPVADPDALPSACQAYAAGALAFRAALLKVAATHRRCVSEDLSFSVATVVPILRQAFDAHGNGELAAGFWDAFACWVAAPFDGCEMASPEGWDVLRELAFDEHFDRVLEAEAPDVSGGQS